MGVWGAEGVVPEQRLYMSLDRRSFEGLDSGSDTIYVQGCPGFIKGALTMADILMEWLRVSITGLSTRDLKII